MHRHAYVYTPLRKFINITEDKIKLFSGFQLSTYEYTNNQIMHAEYTPLKGFINITEETINKTNNHMNKIHT